MLSELSEQVVAITVAVADRVETYLNSVLIAFHGMKSSCRTNGQRLASAPPDRYPTAAMSRTRLRPLLTTVLSTCFMVSGCQGAFGEAPPKTVPASMVTAYAVAGKVTDHALPEISGLAVSRRDPAYLWAMNDSNNPTELFLIDTTGRKVGRVRLAGVRNDDWEDLAAFEYQGDPYLLVADIGDNYANRRELYLHIFAEPELTPGVTGLGGKFKPIATLRFRYPEGPRDAEGVAVDTVRGEILILTKREAKPIFYRLPLRLDSPDERLVAERLGHLEGMPGKHFDDLAKGAIRGVFGQSPTAIDIDADGRSMLVLTYTAVYRLQREPDEDWSEVVLRPATWLADHSLRKAEALSVAPSGDHAYFTSEQLPAPLWRLDLDLER